MSKIHLLSCLLILCTLLSCNSGDSEVTTGLKPTLLFPAVSSTLPPFPESPARNPLSHEGVALGRMLFYEKGLSATHTVSCASCHVQAYAFSRRPSAGEVSLAAKPARDIPPLINLAWIESFFWEGGAKNLESVAFAPIVHPDEMGHDLKELVGWLQQQAPYRAMFEQAFGTDSITAAHIARALAQFQRTLISDKAKYDKVLQGKATFTALEAKGKALFDHFCAKCHTPGLFTDNLYHNNGLDASFDDTTNLGIYQGRYRISENQEDLGKFKTPTLRNIALTAPYMHDGRFLSLEQVLLHYAEGIKKSPTLDTLFNQGHLSLDDKQQKAIIAFLQTLTDSSFIKEKAYTDPVNN